MSFQYDTFQNQQGQQDGSGPRPGPPQEQDTAMGGQLPDNSGAQFQGGNGGDPNSAGGQQQGGDAKTTLWYEPPPMSASASVNVNVACEASSLHCSDGNGRCTRVMGLHFL